MGDMTTLAAGVFKALGHPVRVAMIEALRSGPLCVCEFMPLLGIEQPTASKHIAVLRREGLIVAEKDGQRTMCRLADDTVAAIYDQVRGFLRERWLRQSALWGDLPAGAGGPTREEPGREEAES